MTKTFNIRGQKVRSASQRRYIVVVVRPTAVTVAATGETYVPFARVHKRSDSVETARREANRYGRPGPGCSVVVVDTATGEEVSR